MIIRTAILNVDSNTDFPDARVDVKHDLDVFPYPFADESADEVYTSHTLEHLKNPRKVMKEIHRILKRDGLFILIVPYFTRGYSVHVHEKGFSIWSVLEDTKHEFIAEKVTLMWDHPENFNKGKFILKPFCLFWNGVLNRNYWFSERFLCYLFGGINEVRFVLRKKSWK